MKIALVHDYINEFGGAERVLKTLAEMYPKAPIYTAFSVKGSTAQKELKDKEIHESWLAPLLKIGKLYSPLRFLTPLVWGSFDLSKYDLVITSCSWYITRGFKVGPKTKVIAYCHTPPRWLYGYETSVGFTRYWPVKVYSAIVGHFMRMYDFKTAQAPTKDKEQKTKDKKILGGVDYFIANSNNVQSRIKKFYRRDSTVIYPPVDTERIKKYQVGSRKENYFLIVSRLVGAKGLEEAAKSFKNLPYKLKVVGEAHGYSNIKYQISNIKSSNVELVGRVDDNELYELYAKAKGFIALARDEDFGITPVESMAAGTPVIAFNSGGFRETVIDGVTGVLINDTDERTIKEAIKKLEKTRWDRKKLQSNARKFSKERFIQKVKNMVESI